MDQSLPAVWLKSDLINQVADIHGYRSYLEVCVPYSGNQYDRIDRTKLSSSHRLVYRCPETWSDGLEIDFRSADEEIDGCLRQMADRGLRIEVMLLDPWHEYRTSYRDLEKGFDLIEDDGIIFVHDCLPPDELVTSLTPNVGNWCGLTYKAFIDFVIDRRDLFYCTIDADWGCGVIRKVSAPAGLLHRVTAHQRKLLSEWRLIGNDFSAAFRFYEQHRESLLNIVTPRQFIEAERRRARWRIVRRLVQW